MRPFTKDEFEILKAARKLIKKEENWCKEFSALDKANRPTDWWSKDACRFCLSGALSRAASDLEGLGLTDTAYGTSLKLRDRIKEHGANKFVSVFNDTHTHKEVIKLLNDAIKEEKNV